MVPAYGAAPNHAKPSAGTVMIKNLDIFSSKFILLSMTRITIMVVTRNMTPFNIPLCPYQKGPT